MKSQYDGITKAYNPGVSKDQMEPSNHVIMHRFWNVDAPIVLGFLLISDKANKIDVTTKCLPKKTIWGPVNVLPMMLIMELVLLDSFIVQRATVIISLRHAKKSVNKSGIIGDV